MMVDYERGIGLAGRVRSFRRVLCEDCGKLLLESLDLGRDDG